MSASRLAARAGTEGIDAMHGDMAEEGTLVDNYRPISVLAAIGVTLAVVSLVAYLSPVLLLISGIAVIVNAVAVRHVSSRRQELAGLNMARFGLIASIAILLSAGFAGGYRYYQNTVQAKFAANRYFDLVLSNRLAEAMLYRLFPVEYEGKELAEVVDKHSFQLREVLEDPLTVEFQGKAKETQVVFQGLAGFVQDPRRLHTQAIYRVTRGGNTYDVRIRVHAEYASGGEWSGLAWRVEGSDVTLLSAGE